MEEIQIHRAAVSDLPAIVALLADDPIGAKREDPTLPIARSYQEAFAAIEADPNQILAVVTAHGKVIGTLQITLIPGISRTGAWRGQIEGVRIARDYRDTGIGRSALEWAVEECRSRGCSLIQLTTDKARPDAHRFYEGLGFTASHLGFKKML